MGTVGVVSLVEPWITYLLFLVRKKIAESGANQLNHAREVIFNSIPNNYQINAIVVVRYNISHANDLTPRDRG